MGYSIRRSIGAAALASTLLVGTAASVVGSSSASAVTGTTRPAPSTFVAPASVVSASAAKVVTKRGDRGARVRRVQFALKRRGYHVAVNGKFGPQTHAAVSRFQKRRRIAVTGLVDHRTWRALGLGAPPTPPTTTTTTTATPPETTYRHPKPLVERWHSVALEVGWPESKWKRLSCLIDRESRGNPKAYNPSGAMGLLQIVYRWHKSRVGPDSSVLYDGTINLQVGLKIHRASGWAPWGNACG